MSTMVDVEKINIQFNIRNIVKELDPIEAPINLLINNEYIFSLLEEVREGGF